MSAISPQACTADFTAALIRRDMPAALALLADEVVFFYSNGTVIRGKDAFAAAMTASWEGVTDYEYRTLDSTWIARSDAAASVIYAFAWSGAAGGQAVSGGGRGTRVLIRPGGGGLLRRRSGWLIAHEHLSNGAWSA